MSKHETPLIRKYWNKVGGILIEEFLAVHRAKDRGPRLIDAIIITNRPKRIAHWSEVSLEGEDIIVVQAKASRLGMYLMGQAVFSRELMKPFKPASIKSVAICTKDDSTLRPLLENHSVDVVVMAYKKKQKESKKRNDRLGEIIPSRNARYL